MDLAGLINPDNKYHIPQWGECVVGYVFWKHPFKNQLGNQFFGLGFVFGRYPKLYGLYHKP